MLFPSGEVIQILEGSGGDFVVGRFEVEAQSFDEVVKFSVEGGSRNTSFRLEIFGVQQSFLAPCRIMSRLFMVCLVKEVVSVEIEMSEPVIVSVEVKTLCLVPVELVEEV